MDEIHEILDLGDPFRRQRRDLVDQALSAHSVANPITAFPITKPGTAGSNAPRECIVKQS
jgi:hypothetical protein